MRALPFNVRPYRSAAKPHLKFVVVANLNGRRAKKFFATEAEAKTYAHLRNTETMQYGSEAVIPTWLRVMVQRCQDRLAAHKKTIEDATNHYLSFLEQRQRSCSVEKLFNEMIEEKRQSGFGASYIRSLETAKRRFVNAFSEKLVSEISVRDIDDFLRQFNHLNAVTRNYYRQLIVIAFSHAERHGYCSANVASKSSVIKEVPSPVGILRPEELARLLAACSPRILAAVAIGAFAGVRTSELARLDWREINLRDSESYIEITAANAKSSRRRLVKILPCLAAWLRPFAKNSGPVIQTSKQEWSRIMEYYNYRKLAAKQAGVIWPKNALRHSFASYHISKFKDAAALALEMGHRTTNLIFSHYREVVTPDKAEEYWQLAPFSRPELSKIFAFTPEAYPWHVTVHSLVSDGEWLEGITDFAHYFGFDPTDVYYLLNKSQISMQRPPDDRFHIPTWRDLVEGHKYTKPNYKRFGPFYAKWTLPMDFEERRYFSTESEALQYADASNQQNLEKELNFENLPNVLEFAAVKQSHSDDTAQSPLLHPAIENAGIVG